MRTTIQQAALIESMRHILPNGKVIIDERCTCGKLRSQHLGLMGHGGLREEAYSVECKQFTWKDWIFGE